MPTVSATIPITANAQKITLNPPNQPSIYFKSVAVYNASAYLLTINLPDGGQDFVNPSTAALFALTGAGSVSAQAGSIPGFTLPTNNVWAVFYDSTDTPGTFPVGLPAPGTIGLVQVTNLPAGFEVIDPVTGLAAPEVATQTGNWDISGGTGSVAINPPGGKYVYLFWWSIVIDASPTPTVYKLEDATYGDLDYYAVGSTGRVNANQNLHRFRSSGVSLAQAAGGPAGVLARVTIGYTIAA